MVLQEFGTEQIHHVLKAALAVRTFTFKNGWIGELLIHLFRVSSFAVTLVNDTRFFKSVLDNSQAKTHTLYIMNVQSAFEVQIYFPISPVMQNVSDVLMNLSSHRTLRVVIQSYLWFNLSVIQFRSLPRRSDTYVLLKRQKTLVEAGPPQQGRNAVNASVIIWSRDVDE